MTYLYLMWRNLQRRRIRTIFTFLSIAVAFLLFGLLMALRYGFEAGVELAGQNRLMTVHKVSVIQMLPIRYLGAIKSTPGVRNATHFSWFGGIYQDPKNFFPNMAVDPESFLALYPEFVLPAEQREQWLQNRTGAVVGRKLADRFGWKIGDRIPLRATFYRPIDGNQTFEFELVGIYTGKTSNVDETQFLFRYDYLAERTGDRGETGWFALEVEDPAHADQVALAIDRQFANSPAETKTATEKAFMQSYAKQIGDTGAMLSAISAIVFFVILLIAGNTMAQSVRERTNELGVLKTIGFTDLAVTGMVLGESVLLTTLAGVIGLGLAMLGTGALATAVEAFLPVFYIPVRSLVLGLILSVLLGVACGGLPAFLAQRLTIVEALRRR